MHANLSLDVLCKRLEDRVAAPFASYCCIFAKYHVALMHIVQVYSWFGLIKSLCVAKHECEMVVLLSQTPGCGGVLTRTSPASQVRSIAGSDGPC